MSFQVMCGVDIEKLLNDISHYINDLMFRMNLFSLINFINIKSIKTM